RGRSDRHAYVAARRPAGHPHPRYVPGPAKTRSRLDLGGMSCHPPETESIPVGEQNVCLVGMPNAGKTTLMNALTGGNFKTANYPGVTVSLLRGRTKPEFGPVRNLIDLPGVHSVIAPSPEEELACSVIEGKHAKVK